MRMRQPTSEWTDHRSFTTCGIFLWSEEMGASLNGRGLDALVYPVRVVKKLQLHDGGGEDTMK